MFLPSNNYSQNGKIFNVSSNDVCPRLCDYILNNTKQSAAFDFEMYSITCRCKNITGDYSICDLLWQNREQVVAISV